MEYQQQKGRTSLMLRGTPVDQWKPDEKIFDECRNLVRVLMQKTEILDRENPVDLDTAKHIQTMGSTLEVLADLINRLDHQSQASHTLGILKDARGFTYHSVRSCDLDRISDK